MPLAEELSSVAQSPIDVVGIVVVSESHPDIMIIVFKDPTTRNLNVDTDHVIFDKPTGHLCRELLSGH